MRKKNFRATCSLLLAAIACFLSTDITAATEVNVEKAGTLSSLIETSDPELKVTGVINGTDIKFIRDMVKAGTVTSLDWSGVRIVSGGDAYFESFKTENDVIGEKMFTDCSKLETMVLPSSVNKIQSNAFSHTGLKAINIPSSVKSLGNDAFAYCSSLETVVIGKNVNQMYQGIFYSSEVKDAYVKPLTPPDTPPYLFSSRPKIHVYTEALSDYRQTKWKDFGTLTGGLEDTYPQEPDDEVAGIPYRNFFEDAACTQLKPEYQAMTDEDLTAALNAVDMPELMITTALKVKNGSWAKYEQDFRIHSYKPYSDANYWNAKMMSSGGSYMGNPTGIYAKNTGDKIYVFVDTDIPADATLYITGCVENKLINNARSGKKLVKGLNIVEGTANALYYILYTADTTPMTKTIDEWPEIKIHIEGGVVNGYYDLSRHSDSDYQAILEAATLNRFTIKGEHSLYHLKTISFKTVFPESIDKSITWFDHVVVWEKELMGMCESVASGQRAGYPWYLTGGEAIYPIYYNNPCFAIEGEPSDAGYANSATYRTSYNGLDCIRNCLDPTNPVMDDWCAAHENGHNNQKTINLEGCTEASNNLFSNYVYYLGGLNTSNGSALSTVMEEYARHDPFYFRPLDSRLRMYWDLYLYYHLGQKNTSFYPELFKALRNDPLSLYNTSHNNNGGLKFVRKVCEVAQEDLTDFFTIWGFFEPIEPTTIEDYGNHPIAVTSNYIARTKATIAKYEKKNREIIFIEDRADYVLSTGLIRPAGEKRRGSEKVGQYGDLGQFTDYWPNGCTPSDYFYLQADSLYAMEGTGGLGFLMLDTEGKLKYASNAKNLCIPTSIGDDFTIYSYDADGSLHEVTKGGEGIEIINVIQAGHLCDDLTDKAIKATITGNINSTDFKYMREMINDGNLLSIDLSGATVVRGGTPYYENYSSRANGTGDYTFHGFKKLTSMILPNGLVKIGSNSFAHSGLKMINIPDKVTTINGDAFAYCDKLTKVIIGESVQTIAQGGFYSSPVKDAYVKALTPPSVSNYLFSSKPTIHVYARSLAKYKASRWAEYGTIVGDLDDLEDVLGGIDTPVVSDEDMEDPSQGKYYDLYGRRVTNLQPNTIYVHNGKKIIINK